MLQNPYHVRYLQKCCTRYRGGGVSDSHMKVGVGKFVFNLPISKENVSTKRKGREPSFWDFRDRWAVLAVEWLI